MLILNKKYDSRLSYRLEITSHHTVIMPNVFKGTVDLIYDMTNPS